MTKTNYRAFCEGYERASMLPGIKAHAPWIIGLIAFWATIAYAVFS